MDGELIINLSGLGWDARLEVAAPEKPHRRRVEFPLMWSPDDRQPRIVAADVFYTTARNVASGAEWRKWHIKIYQCAEQGEATALRRYLRDQARHILEANTALPGAGNPAQPPWGVVPVQIVRGDSQADQMDTVRTRLNIDSHRMQAIGGDYPEWFADSPQEAARTIIAVAPFIDEPTWTAYYRERVPATHHLPDFANIAMGLDRMHAKGTVHCDIKPDNVCRVTVPGFSAYVLIDTDAAARADANPRFLRFTSRYAYAGVQRAFNGQSMSSDPQLGKGVLLAQDRFGFALVVLGALAGREWVGGTLLSTDEDEGFGARKADRQDEVVAALAAHWPDPRWADLIRVLSVAFSQDIEDPDWSLQAWLQQVIDTAKGQAAGAGDRPRRHAAEITRIRAEANVGPAVPHERVESGYRATARRMHAVAQGAAKRSMLKSAGFCVLIAMALVIGGLVLGK